MYNVMKEIQNINNLCISSDEKEQRIEELEQLNHSIAYTCSVLHFFWNDDIMVSYKRDERYTIVDMLGKLILISIDSRGSTASTSKGWTKHATTRTYKFIRYCAA